MLVGLLHPTSGTVRVCGHNATTNPREATRFIGYVPDQPYLYDKLSAREFLEFVGEMRGLNRRETAEAIARQSEQFELGGFLDDLTETYSHGMKQRVVFAAALLHNPSVIVVDEPMVGLDPKSMRLVKDLLRARANAGAAVFMSTHTLAVAEEISDRIGIIDHGRLNFLGTKEQLERELLAREHLVSAEADEGNGSSRTAEERSLEHLFLRLTAGGNGSSAASSSHVPGEQR
jgi:ABC-2 type transport system ATP-binding protein